MIYLIIRDYLRQPLAVVCKGEQVMGASQLVARFVARKGCCGTEKRVKTTARNCFYPTVLYTSLFYEKSRLIGRNEFEIV